MAKDLRTLIDDGGVHVTDGAMGTMLYQKGVFVNVCYDELSLKQSKLVQEIHEAYLDAGAEVIETNTFGANPLKLKPYGLADQTAAINEAAASLAVKVAGDDAAVAGAIGPLGIRIEPFGPTGRDEAVGLFRTQVKGLVAGGVTGFILETFSDLEELEAAIEAVRSQSDLPIIAQMTVEDAGETAYGTDVKTITRRLSSREVDVIGLNCSVGPAAMLEAIERMAHNTSKPISAQPNAGFPREIGDRKIYLASPEYMATYAKMMIEAGARFVGGCCGTTPEHIKEISKFVVSVSPRHAPAHVSIKEISTPEGVTPVALAERSSWGAKIAAGEFVSTIEIVPPRGCNPAPMLDQCRKIKEAGVDAVNVPDGPRAQSRMGVLASAILIQNEVGIEPVIHYACRDRNLLGMMSDLLGAAAAGIRNLLIVTGDPPKMGPYPDSTAVFDIDSIGLTNLVYRLNHGLDPGNNPIGDPTRFTIGVGVNPAAVEMERELKRFYWKVDAGAEFAVTQPVFDPDQLETFLNAINDFRIPVIAGIWPLISFRNAEFLANEVPGVSVPSSVLERMRRAQEGGKERALEEGVTIAREMFQRVKDMVQGVQVSAPFGRVHVAVQVFSD